jgi:hypothetical protein
MKPISRRQLVTGLAAAGAAVAVLRPAQARADQPHMEAALDALKTAERELKAANADKGGHRGKAIQYVKEAIVQVERGIGFARKH